MPAEYIIRQMAYFKSGARKEEARMGPIARAVADEDVRQAAEYFAAIKPAPFVKVIEAATPPKTYVSADARHRRIMPDGGTEPIGRRIIQIPEDPMQVTVRNPHSGFIAYVHPEASRRERVWSRQAAEGKPFSAPSATAMRSPGSANCRASPACSRSTLRGSSFRCRTEPAPGQTPR
jgi:hypothetical protein